MTSSTLLESIHRQSLKAVFLPSLADALRPLIANSNGGTNQIVNGPFTTGLSAGQFQVFTLATTDLVINLSSYFAP